MEHSSTLGDRLTQAMKRRGLKNPDVAARLGVHVVTVSKWRSDRQLPDDESVRRLAELLDVSPAWLRYEVGPQTGAPDTSLSLADLDAYGLGSDDLVRVPGLSEVLLQMPDHVHAVVWPFLGQMERAGLGTEARDRVHALATQLSTGHFTPGHKSSGATVDVADAHDLVEAVRRIYARRGVTIGTSAPVAVTEDPDAVSGADFVRGLDSGKRKPKAG